MSSVAKLKASLHWLLRSSMLRLTLVLSATFTLGMAVAIILTLFFGRDAVLERVDTTLAGIAASVATDNPPADSSAMLIRPFRQLGDLPEEFSRISRKGGSTVNLDNDYRHSEDWRVLIANDRNGNPTLIALPLDDSTDALELLGGILWTVAILVLITVIAIGLFLGFLAQRRLSRINETLNALASGDLQARTGLEDTSDDLDDLAYQVDQAAAELERLVGQTRTLSASIAHDLRTPLARLRAKLETMPAGDERGAALEEAERLAGIFDAIMRVARIEAGHGTEGFERVDLSALTTELEEIFAPVVEDSGKALVIANQDPGIVHADRKMVIQAMANLIQNAIVHGGPNITLFANGTAIGVGDDGEGVDAANHDEILKPMVRLDAARERDGSGLGLALVRAVADRHGATLNLSQNDPQGLQISIKFTNL